MSSYYRDGQNWQEYLNRSAFAEDVSVAIQQLKREIDSKPDDREDQIDNLGFISEGIAGLQSAFDIAMEKVLWKLQMQLKSVSEILVDLRSQERENEANTSRSCAEHAYINGWYEEALADFLKAEKQNSRDFSVFRSIANIYLYEQLNYDKALEYYQKCAKFAVPYSKVYTAEALMLTAWMCYLKRDDAGIAVCAGSSISPNAHAAT